jgi:hypothetical protein
MIRRQPFYRHDAFMAGLKAAGFQVFEGAPKNPPFEDDVLCIWNRYGEVEAIADRFEAQGGTVIVAENGYLNPGGGNPKFDAHEGKPGYYALALDGHNGSGRWPSGDGSRWQALGIELKPWRTDGEHILVCPNRPFGSRKMVPPARWAEDVRAAYSKVTPREIRVRAHPGNTRPARTLAQDLENCFAVVIWSSTAGLHALLSGIYVACESRYWICKEAAAGGGIGRYEAVNSERLASFERLAWAQWHIDEIATGYPFERLMAMTAVAA